MKKIDVSGWKEFKIGDYFDAERGKVQSLQRQESGKIPVIAAAGFNQGIAGFYNVKSAYKNRITVSCNGAGCGSTFYHDYEFNITGDAIVLLEKISMHDFSKMFITCVLNGLLTRKYSYEEKCSSDKVKETKILLPATPAGIPDWQYMENFMRSIADSTRDTLSRIAIRASECIYKKVTFASGSRMWRKYRVGDYFNLYLSKDDIQPKLLNNGQFPLVSSGKENNGICSYIEEQDAKLWPAGTITVDMFGKVFYQNIPYYCVSHGRVNILEPKCSITEMALRFVCVIIEKITTQRYGFTNMCTGTKLKEKVILLPSTPAGAPDWEYMEEYIKKVKKDSAKKVEALRKIK